MREAARAICLVAPVSMVTDLEPSMRSDRSFRTRKTGFHPLTYSLNNQEAEIPMTKNPWMSVWLSAANTWAGAARGHWSAEVRRQQKKMLSEMAKPRAPSASKSRSFKKSAPGARRKSER